MKQQPKLPFEPDVWRQPDGEPLACEEKIDVLRENLAEIQHICQEALEDAVLMQLDETQLRATLHQLIDALNNPYAKKQ